jgi:UDP-N-acetylglucosamine--N-acetylmuramyl-(pentapeptide) pyrophosphoryl-undecaprenol N-acetylglucosamine transferase
MRIGIAAAGSGGHVYPALAVADALTAGRFEKEDIIFFGGNRMEKTKVPDAGYPFVELDIHGFQRSLSMRNLKLPLKIRTATRAIAATIEAKDIEAMIVFGGYVSGPAALAASRSHIPLVVHEANAVPGLANRMVARRAALVLVAIEPTTRGLNSPIVVGNPLRSSFDTFDRQSLRPVAMERYGIADDAEVLAVIGGSLGAAALNTIARRIGERPDRRFHILQLAGEAHADAVSDWAQAGTKWTVRGFEDEMEYVYAAADLAITRGGAMTISELEATGTPAIVVPLPAAKGYQALNAAEIEAAGGAVIVDQAEADIVVDLAFEIMEDHERRAEMAKQAAATGRRGAAEAVASMTMALIDA